ncbi:endonuclease V [Halopenitus sp. H-Gu1]|uniref:endonuclease V n=1 Tax=Halopenitus sp. H-Gu1 TaxID=3242697 RepID=UPI00359E211B
MSDRDPDADEPSPDRSDLDLVRPEFLPDPDLSREEMETLQRDISDAAIFEDAIEVDPDEIALRDAFDLSTGIPDPTDRRPTLGTDPAPDPSAPVVVGIDQAFLEESVISAVVALRGDRVVERTYAVSPLSIPYIPGLLAFREGGPILDALSTLSVDPDLALLDGSGRIHFRQAGIATHIGVILDLPSVGVAKNLLCGTPDDSPEERPAGWSTPVRADDRVEAPDGTVLGHAYQSRQYPNERRINPLYVSPGHRVSAETSLAIVDALCAGYKLPEPTRLADVYADEVKRSIQPS